MGNLRYSSPRRESVMDSKQDTERSHRNPLHGNNGPNPLMIDDQHMSEQTFEDEVASEIVEEEHSRR